jgi:hypothetical protein
VREDGRRPVGALGLGLIDAALRAVLGWIFIDSPVPAREMTRSSLSMSTVIGPESVSPRWSGVFSAKTTVRRPPVMSSSLGAPVSVQFSTAKLSATTVNST